MVEKQTQDKGATAKRSPARARPTRTEPAATLSASDSSAAQAREPSPSVAAGGPQPSIDDGKSAKPTKPPKLKKAKPVRDSFTMPQAEYELIDLLKRRVQAKGRKVKKSELLRAGILALADMRDAQLFAAIDAVPVIKTGRPPAAGEPAANALAAHEKSRS